MAGKYPKGTPNKRPNEIRETYSDVSVLRSFGVYMSKVAHEELMKMRDQRRRSLVKKLERVAIARYEKRCVRDDDGVDFKYCPHCGNYQSKYITCLNCGYSTVSKYPVGIRNAEDLEEMRKTKEADLVEFDNLYCFDRGPWAYNQTKKISSGYNYVRKITSHETKRVSTRKDYTARREERLHQLEEILRKGGVLK